MQTSGQNVRRIGPLQHHILCNLQNPCRVIVLAIDYSATRFSFLTFQKEKRKTIICLVFRFSFFVSEFEKRKTEKGDCIPFSFCWCLNIKTKKEMTVYTRTLISWVINTREDCYLGDMKLQSCIGTSWEGVGYNLRCAAIFDLKGRRIGSDTPYGPRENTGCIVCDV